MTRNEATNIAVFASVASTAISRNNQNGDNNLTQPFKAKSATVNAVTSAITDEVTPDELDKAVKLGNAIFQAEQRELFMNVDEATKKVVVKIVDRSTGDIIQQLPTKEVLNFIKAMQERAGGNGMLIKNSA